MAVQINFRFFEPTFFQFLYFAESRLANPLNSLTHNLVQHLQKGWLLYEFPLVGEDSYVSHREK